jgi:hypothetical protein
MVKGTNNREASHVCKGVVVDSGAFATDWSPEQGNTGDVRTYNLGPIPALHEAKTSLLLQTKSSNAWDESLPGRVSIKGKPTAVFVSATLMNCVGHRRLGAPGDGTRFSHN